MYCNETALKSSSSLIEAVTKQAIQKAGWAASEQVSLSTRHEKQQQQQ
jgi:hypothetical protein